ncbi:PREDICTED: uncharacterized protein LOC104798487 [Tarenaya hassleriana]|uniref:uncharacterized protein LOC104798487 n=1 Tax=Tarenaya hassleriana TaxID=28532 RepID=UPI00053CA7DD|nr:PREDICTED: uncharacterized protein LOC104798487 [Tarenaya hassleriana]XP_010518908.1 PREDICTED: uncharacterized protein LOC104798487 [Tarenaya hassleriana]
MQRLSLDSSASKLHGYGGRKDEVYNVDDLKRKESSPSPSSSSSSAGYDDHEFKDSRPRRLSLQSSLSASHHKQEKLVHFIPVLTLICFIILYLTSHTPSQSDLAHFNGFKPHLESGESSDISGFVRADALSIRSSIRNLQETEKYPSNSLPARHRTSHRKTADF